MATFITPVTKTVGSNDTWTNIDCSANIPSGATGVMVRVRTNSTWSETVGLRNDGSTDTLTASMPSYDSLPWGRTFVIGVTSRIFEALAGNSSSVFFDVIGYFESDWTFLVNGVAKTPTIDTWVNSSIASDTGGETAIAAAVYVASVYRLGVRHGDSSETREFNAGGGQGLTCAIVGCNASEEFGIRSDTGAALVVGWATSGIEMYVNGIDRSIGSTGTYTDLTALPAGAIGGIYHAVGTGIYNDQWALRENGSSDDPYFTGSSQDLVKCDASRIVEGKINDLAVAFWEQGYFTDPAPPPAYPWSIDAQIIRRIGA